MSCWCSKQNNTAGHRVFPSIFSWNFPCPFGNPSINLKSRRVKGQSYSSTGVPLQKEPRNTSTHLDTSIRCREHISAHWMRRSWSRCSGSTRWIQKISILCSWNTLTLQKNMQHGLSPVLWTSTVWRKRLVHSFLNRKPHCDAGISSVWHPWEKDPLCIFA